MSEFWQRLRAAAQAEGVTLDGATPAPSSPAPKPASNAAPWSTSPVRPIAKHCPLIRTCRFCRQRIGVRMGRLVAHERTFTQENGPDLHLTCDGSGKLIMPLVELVALVGPELAGVEDEHVEQVRCGCCSQRVPVYEHRISLHTSGPRRPDLCPNSGKIVRSKLRSIGTILVAQFYMARTLRETMFKRHATLRQCPSRWSPTKESHALVTFDEVSTILAASWRHVNLNTRAWLWRNQTARDAMAHGVPVLAWALEVPLKPRGGMCDRLGRDDDGNAAGRYLDALPFSKRQRRDAYPSRFNAYGEFSGTYSGGYATDLFLELRERNIAVRAPRKVARPITSWAGGQSGPWDSTGKRYPNRFVESDTYYTREALRAPEHNKHLRRWAEAVRQTCTKEYPYIWRKTEAARRARRWLTYSESLQEPDEQRQLIQARQIARNYAARANSRSTNCHQLINTSKSSISSAAPPLPGGLAFSGSPSPPGSAVATGPPSSDGTGRRKAGQEKSKRHAPPETSPVCTQDAELLVLEALLVSDPEDW